MLGQSLVSRMKIAWRGQVYPGEKLVPKSPSSHFGYYKTIRTVACFQVITIELQKNMTLLIPCRPIFFPSSRNRLNNGGSCQSVVSG